MEILTQKESNTIRKKYIKRFINMESDYYVNNIQKMTDFKDGLFYTGYLWDCFKSVEIISRETCDNLLKNTNLYVFWDLHSSERIFIGDYWKYPIDCVLKMDYDNFLNIEKDLPEDLYLCDQTFLWSVAFTHEEDLLGNRMLYYVNIEECRK